MVIHAVYILSDIQVFHKTIVIIAFPPEKGSEILLALRQDLRLAVEVMAVFAHVTEGHVLGLVELALALEELEFPQGVGPHFYKAGVALLLYRE